MLLGLSLPMLLICRPLDTLEIVSLDGTVVMDLESDDGATPPALAGSEQA